jgi:hypothetical protein
MPNLLFVNHYYLILLFELNRLLKKAKYKLIFHPKAIEPRLPIFLLFPYNRWTKQK